MIPGFRIGHYSDFENLTGCSVVLAPPEGAVGGVDVRGPAPGTRETELLRTGHLIERAHAILLTGGSAFGLDAAAGVMRYLEEQNIGYDTGIARVPIVAAAVLFDLGVGNAKARPNTDAGYDACLNAREVEPAQGSVGAGTGATVGKLFGSKYSTKGGMGYAARTLGSVKARTQVAALVVTNAFGDIVESNTGAILAGTRDPNGNGWLDTAAALQGDVEFVLRPLTNTTLGVVMTDAPLDTEEANIVAMMAQTGVSRVTRPAHSMYDGDTIFVLANGGGARGNLTAIGHAVAECVAEAIVRGIKSARSLGGVRAWDDK